MHVRAGMRRVAALGAVLAIGMSVVPSVGAMAAGDAVRTVEVSNNYTPCAVRTDDTVWCWGNNDSDGVGDGTDVDQRDTPVQVQRPSGPLRKVVSIAQGDYHACAVRRNGTVACWGAGTANGGVDSSNVALVVPGLTNVVDLAAGDGYTCARRADRTVWCWGNDSSESLGNGAGGSGSVPGQVRKPGGRLKNVIAIAAGRDTVCALMPTRTLRCWGGNEFGQLLDGTTDDNGLARVVKSGSRAVGNVAVVDIGRGHICVAQRSGSARCWGNNQDGQLGDGTRQDRTNAVRVRSVGGTLSRVTDISVGPSLSCAIAGARAHRLLLGIQRPGTGGRRHGGGPPQEGGQGHPRTRQGGSGARHRGGGGCRVCRAPGPGRVLLGLRNRRLDRGRPGGRHQQGHAGAVPQLSPGSPTEPPGHAPGSSFGGPDDGPPLPRRDTFDRMSSSPTLPDAARP